MKKEKKAPVTISQRGGTNRPQAELFLEVLPRKPAA